MNKALHSELLRMQTEDIAMRRELIDAGELYKYGYHPRMAEVHRKNNARMREIVAQHGWPGRTLVAEEGSEAAWLIVQHAILDPDLQQRCVELLTDAVAKGEAPARHLAMLTDRVLMEQGEPQIYGCITVGDDQGGVVLWKVADPDQVDERRREVGLPPLAENMRRIEAEVDFNLSKQREAEEAAQHE